MFWACKEIAVKFSPACTEIVGKFLPACKEIAGKFLPACTEIAGKFLPACTEIAGKVLPVKRLPVSFYLHVQRLPVSFHLHVHRLPECFYCVKLLWAQTVRKDTRDNGRSLLSLYLSPQSFPGRSCQGVSSLAFRHHSSKLCHLVGCCFTSTETVGLLGTGAQDNRLDFHTGPELWNSAIEGTLNSYLCVSVCLSRSCISTLSAPPYKSVGNSLTLSLPRWHLKTYKSAKFQILKLCCFPFRISMWKYFQ